MIKVSRLFQVEMDVWLIAGFCGARQNCETQLWLLDPAVRLAKEELLRCINIITVRSLLTAIQRACHKFVFSTPVTSCLRVAGPSSHYFLEKSQTVGMLNVCVCFTDLLTVYEPLDGRRSISSLNFVISAHLSMGRFYFLQPLFLIVMAYESFKLPVENPVWDDITVVLWWVFEQY